MSPGGSAGSTRRAATDPAVKVQAVVSRGGRPDLAGDKLPEVSAPTLLIVGGRDELVLDLNRRAAAAMRAECRVVMVPARRTFFEEPGTLEQVAVLARDCSSHAADFRQYRPISSRTRPVNTVDNGAIRCPSPRSRGRCALDAQDRFDEPGGARIFPAGHRHCWQL